jgi:phage-related protein
MSDWEVEYYETASGSVPVEEWLASMTPQERADGLRYIDQLALLGIEARYPLIKPLGNKLYELRWKSANKQHRIAYFAARGRTFVLLHGFIKKTQETPKKELALAITRMRDYEQRKREEDDETQ